MTTKIQKIIQYALLIFVFVVPWQTRWQYAKAYINGGLWEYGSESVYATEIFGWSIVVVFAIVLCMNKDFWRRVKAGFANQKRNNFIFFGLGCLGLTLVMSQNRNVSMQWIEWSVLGACLAVVIINCGIERKKLLTFFWLGGVAQAFFGAYQFLTQSSPASRWLGLAYHSARQFGDFVVEFGDERWLRAYGSFGSPNILGGYLAVCIVLGLYLYALYATEDTHQEQRFRVLKILFTLGQLALTVGLVVSFSRGSWIAALVGTVLFLIFSLKEKMQLKKILELAAACLAIVLILYIPLKPLFNARIQSTGRLETRSFVERLNQLGEWKQVFATGMLVGTGPGAYTRTLYEIYPNRPVWQYQPVHNAYLVALGEVGMVGVLALVICFSRILRYVYINNRQLIGPLAVIATGALFDHFWWSLYSGVILVWVVIGLASAKDTVKIE